jgi:hypothetical protein
VWCGELVARPSSRLLLKQLKGIGPEIASVLYFEGLFRSFGNRRQLAAYAGLAPTPWRNGTVDQEQGISKAGNLGACPGHRRAGGGPFSGLVDPQPTSSHAPTRPRPDEESLFEQKRSEMTACDQRLEVPFDSIGDQGAGHSDPDLDVAQLGGLGEIC